MFSLHLPQRVAGAFTMTEPANPLVIGGGAKEGVETHMICFFLLFSDRDVGRHLGTPAAYLPGTSDTMIFYGCEIRNKQNWRLSVLFLWYIPFT